MLSAPPMWLCLLAVAVSASLETAANLFLVKSEGFKKLYYAALSLLMVALAFSLLALAIRGLPLAVAYSTWGAVGILGTSLGGWAFFGQKLHKTAWLGIILLICGMTLLHMH